MPLKSPSSRLASRKSRLDRESPNVGKGARAPGSSIDGFELLAGGDVETGDHGAGLDAAGSGPFHPNEAPAAAAQPAAKLCLQPPSAAGAARFVLVLVAGAAVPALVYGLLYVFGLVGNSNGEDVEQCLTASEFGNASTLEMDTLLSHCSCVPAWMAGSMYFDPAATLYLAIAAVLGFLLLNRLAPLSKIAATSLRNECAWSRCKLPSQACPPSSQRKTPPPCHPNRPPLKSSRQAAPRLSWKCFPARKSCKNSRPKSSR
jgi:hypothetical protein